jgi:hypothetical protein
VTTLHTLRHTHASELIRKGADILTISRRLGHSSAAITLGVCGHLMSAADIVEAMLGGKGSKAVANPRFVLMKIHVLRLVSNRVLLLLCLMYLILYVDRVNISTAAPLIKADLALTNAIGLGVFRVRLSVCAVPAGRRVR